MNDGGTIMMDTMVGMPYLGVLGCAGLAEGVEKCCDGGDGGLADGVLPNCSL